LIIASRIAKQPTAPTISSTADGGTDRARSGFNAMLSCRAPRPSTPRLPGKLVAGRARERPIAAAPGGDAASRRRVGSRRCGTRWRSGGAAGDVCGRSPMSDSTEVCDVDGALRRPAGPAFTRGHGKAYGFLFTIGRARGAIASRESPRATGVDRRAPPACRGDTCRAAAARRGVRSAREPRARSRHRSSAGHPADGMMLAAESKCRLTVRQAKAS
jgi:hypothetical protein